MLELVGGKVMVVLSVPARVSVLLADKVLPLVMVKVPVLLEIVKPLTVVNAPVVGVVAPTVPFNAPENPVDVRIPDDGLNWSLVDDTSRVVSLPVVTFENVMYRVALVVVSSVIVTPLVTVLAIVTSPPAVGVTVIPVPAVILVFFQ